jgi:aminoglycoside 3-N-acetyltransferase
MKIKEITKILKKAKIRKGNTILIHGDLGAISQINTKKNIIKIFLGALKKVLGPKGTVLIPTFSYSFCKNEIFNPNKTKSEIGSFSESLRLSNIGTRTDHPIFSFYILGNKKKYYLNSNNETCFGTNSIFDLFMKDNGKICGLGCGFANMMTFLHYIEESFQVKYRYHKIFKGNIIKDKKKIIYTSYFVRSSNKKIIYDYSKIEKQLHNKIKYTLFGRYNLITIEAKNLFTFVYNNLKKDSRYLLK